MFNALLLLGIIAISTCIVMCSLVLGMQIGQRTVLAGQQIMLNRILVYLDSIERYCQTFNEDVQEMEGGNGIWRSVDGKYQANTIDELMQQMKNAPGKQRSEADVNSFIKDINSESEWHDEEYYEEEEEDGEDEPFM